MLLVNLRFSLRRDLIGVRMVGRLQFYDGWLDNSGCVTCPLPRARQEARRGRTQQHNRRRTPHNRHVEAEQNTTDTYKRRRQHNRHVGGEHNATAVEHNTRDTYKEMNSRTQHNRHVGMEHKFTTRHNRGRKKIASTLCFGQSYDAARLASRRAVLHSGVHCAM